MNFIGHATVALWVSAEPAFVLGAMLPDFASMAGTRLAPLTGDEPLARGVALHHRTDDAFHSAPQFLALMQQTIERLGAEEVPRGPARAIGHIGVEMLIDGELVGGEGVAAAYVRALEATHDVPPSVFRSDSGAERWQRVHERLIAHGVPYDYRNTDAVVTRLERVLRSHPRLALDPRSERIARSVLPDIRRAVGEQVPALLEVVRERLSPNARAGS